MRTRSIAVQARPIQGLVIVALAFLLGAVWISAAQAVEIHEDHVEVEGDFDTRRDALIWWGLSVYGPTEVGQNLVVEGVTDFRGSLYNSIAGEPLTVGDNFRVKLDTTLKGKLIARGTVKNDQGKLILGDNTKIGGTLNQRGAIYNSGGYVVVDDTLDVQGRTKTRKLTTTKSAVLQGTVDMSMATVMLKGVENAKFTLDKGSAVADQDVALQFSDDGVDSAHALTWDDGDGRFEFGGDSVQATTFVAGTASTTLADGSLSATGALMVKSGGGAALTLDSDSGTVVLGAGSNTLANTDASDLTLSSSGSSVVIDPSDAFVVGGGFGSTGMTVTGAGLLNLDGLASLDGGIDVDGAFTVADTSGNVDTTGTLDVDGLASLDGGIDLDGVFTVADTTGALTTTGLSSLDGGIDVDGAFTVADTSGNVDTTGTLDVDGLASLDGGIDTDGAFTVADTTGNVATTGDVDFADGGSGDTIDIGDVGDTVNIIGDISVSGTTDTTFTTDSDNTGGSEPADGAGFVIEGGSGDVSLLWNSTDNELEFTFGGGNADIQGGNGMFDSLDVSGQTTLGTTVDVNATGITLDADNTGGAGVDTVVTFERGTTGTDGTLLFDETTDNRFEFNYPLATSGAFDADTLAIGGGFGSTGLSVSSAGVLDADGLASLDGGIDVDGVFTVTDATGALTTTGLASLDGGIDTDGAFTVADTTGAVDTTGTLDADGLASLDGGIDVDAAFTVADTTGAVDINAGAIDGTDVGQTTAGLGDFSDLFVEDVFGFGVTTLTLTDDGTANDALSPTSSYVEVDADETADGSVPDVTLGGTPADGDLLIIVNVETDASHDTFTITDAAGVALATTVTVGPLDSITLVYNSTASSWIELSRSDN